MQHLQSMLSQEEQEFLNIKDRKIVQDAEEDPMQTFNDILKKIETEKVQFKEVLEHYYYRKQQSQ